MTELEQEKVSLEIEQIKQDMKLAHWRMFLTFASVLIVIVGFGVDRYKIDSDRKWKSENETKRHEISRMTEIAKSFDEIYTETLKKLNVALSRHVVMYVSFDALKESIEDSDVSKKTKDKILPQFEEALKLFQSKDITLNEYSDALALQSIWDTKREGIAPDDFLYFSDNVLSKWGTLADAAWETLNDKFHPFANTESKTNINEFRKLGRELQRAMREEINDRNKS